MLNPGLLEQKHPVAFLNEIRGAIEFKDLGHWGTGDTEKFTIGTNIDGVPYSGTASSRKEAKRNCAADVLTRLYKISVPK